MKSRGKIDVVSGCIKYACWTKKNNPPNDNAIILEKTKRLLETSNDNAILFPRQHFKIKLLKHLFSPPLIAILESTEQQERSLTFENNFK